MKVTVNSPAAPERKLVAVVMPKGEGFFLRTGHNSTHFITQRGEVSSMDVGYTLEERLSLDSGRTPVYEGDTITLQF